MSLESGEEIATYATHMARLYDPDNSSIPTIPKHFQEQMQYISKEDTERLARTTKLTAFQQKFFTWQERLNHLHFLEIFQLVKFGILPNKFLSFQDSKPLCASCLFGKAHIRVPILRKVILGIGNNEFSFIQLSGVLYK